MARCSAFPENLPSFAMAVAVCLLVAATSPSRAQEQEPAIRWEHSLGPQTTVQVDVPQGWEVIAPVDEGDSTRFVPLDGTHCDVIVDFSLAADARPPIAGAEALRALVDAEARDVLDQAVESHYTLRELRGPESAGWFYALRDRAPRKKGALFLQRGALLVRGAILRFRIETPKPDLPAIRQALKMLAGSRFLQTTPLPDDSASKPTGSSMTGRSAGPGEQGGR
jgi:hypothetical protein